MCRDGDHEAGSYVFRGIKVISKNSDDRRPKHCLRKTVYRPHGNHCVSVRHKGQEEVANSRRAKSEAYKMAWLDPVAEKSADQLT